MSRICGVCKQPPREGQEMRPMRLGLDDIEGIEEGLYQACVECVEEHRKRVAARMGVESSQVTNNMMC